MRAAFLPPILAALATGGCRGDGIDTDLPQPARPVAVTGATPFAAGCSGALQRGVRYASAEVEPSLAVDPANPDHLVAAWQQDRWSNSGADGIVVGFSNDGGLTWTRMPVPLSRCGGGNAVRGGDYERATDPWVSFAPGGTVHLVGLGFGSGGRAGILVSRSTDGGLTWSDPRALAADEDPDFGLDKPTLTADPSRPDMVYAVWDRLTGQLVANDPTATGPAWFARSLDGGANWEPARTIYDPGADAQTISNQIVVLPDGTLVNVFVRIRQASTAQASAEVVAMRSPDAGLTWGAPVVVAALLALGAVDAKTGHAIRAGEVVPSAAVDPGSGALVVAWQDARFSDGVRDGIAVATSADGGNSWSPPRQVNAAPYAQAFRPAVSVGSGGRIAVTYYDLRFDSVFDLRHLWTAFWKATSDDGGATWREVREGGPFDLRAAPDSGGYFLGDYTGLVARGDDFMSLFALASPGTADPTDVFVSAPSLAPAATAGAQAPQQNPIRSPLRERVAAMRERGGR